MTEWREQGAEPITEPQRKMLNAVSGCLSAQIRWHGRMLSKDSWRHFLSGMAAGFLTVPAYDRGDGQVGFVMLGKSSLRLTKTQAIDAITMGLHIGDHPEDQGLKSQRVKWSRAVLLGLGFQPDELNQ